MNRCFIVGNLTRDPELRSTRDGTAVCSFTVAVNRRSKNAQAGQPEADFFRVTAWRELVPIAICTWPRAARWPWSARYR